MPPVGRAWLQTMDAMMNVHHRWALMRTKLESDAFPLTVGTEVCAFEMDSDGKTVNAEISSVPGNTCH